MRNMAYVVTVKDVKLKLLCFEGCPLENKPEFKPIFKN